MALEDLALRHLALRLGGDTGAFKQKKPIFLACPARDRKDSLGVLAPLWILSSKKCVLVSLPPPLLKAIKTHHGEKFGEGEFLPPSLIAALAHDLVPFYGPTEANHRTWFLAPEGFAHVQEVEIVPLDGTDEVAIDAISPGWWEKVRANAAAGRAFGARMDGKVVAFSQGRAETDHAWEIDCYTHPEYRGIGLGRELAAHACRAATLAGKAPLFAMPRASLGAVRIAKALEFVALAEDFIFETKRRP
ncbi:MAG: GNAT family N-acetyltransferase [Planctomycetes bacterium]|nr:GNAT family N-acetyltransferase [Planctomycetota bacterium]